MYPIKYVLVKASTDNYFWWINQEDKYVWSSCYSIQFLLYTSPAGAIVVMFQLVVEGQFLETLLGQCEPWTLQGVLGAHYSGMERTLCSGRLMLNRWKQGCRKKLHGGRKALSLPDTQVDLCVAWTTKLDKLPPSGPVPSCVCCLNK